MDAKKTPGHPFQRLPFPHQPPRQQPRPTRRRRAEEDTPIFDQLLKEWRAGAVRPVAAWSADERGKTRQGTVVGGEDGRPRPRNRTEEPA
ncbi:MULTISPECIES: hypothetical protein [unclassified Streptomyces]|uniref:hypothetical protein n=1 Tax=unclassified Streptomyces TaxID=2593676 RepID=UPI0034500B6C